MTFVPLKPLAGSTLSPAPWQTTDDGTVMAADGAVVCVLGAPFEVLQEKDVTNGAAIVAAPQLLAAARLALPLLQDDLKSWLESACTLDPETHAPIRAEIEEEALPFVEPLEAAIAAVQAAIAIADVRP